MVEDTGRLLTTIQFENPRSRGRMVTVPDALVDSRGWITSAPAELLRSLELPVEGTKRFVTATGELVERDFGYAILHVGEAQAFDEVVFAKPGDVILLGARSLSGLNLRVDPESQRLIDAGPHPAAAAA